MATTEDLLQFVPGAKVIISGCEAREHNCDNGCVCDIKGTVQTMGDCLETYFVGTPTWFLEGTDKHVRLAEVTFIKLAATPAAN